MINLIIADDHAIVRSGLARILKAEKDMTVLAEADCHGQLLSKLRTTQADVILLDISMPGRDGLETLKDLKHLYPEIKVLVLSMHPENRYAVRTIKLGAAGYLAKELAADELVKAIRLVNTGGKYITSTLADQIVRSFTHEGHVPLHEKLSDREFQIFNLLASGKDTKDIAMELSLSLTTVANSRPNIFRKLNLKSNVELASYALRHNLID
ncbi:MAG TPA: response regulator transcription factor [Cyclobacteriaceae bacterium]|jgi:DNA-binding NarL/FixJ family response regulator|nr:response regulator transcription factor [Cyclobacteriaceae bacterium]